MLFKIRVTVCGDNIYDIDAEDEAAARKKATENAEKEFECDRKRMNVLSLYLLCPSCKKEMYSTANYCYECGTPRPRAERTETKND